MSDYAANQPGERPRRRAADERRQTPIFSQLARERHVLTAERRYELGAIGEEQTGRELAQLPAAWRVLHGVEVGRFGADIDHLVIGPGGVFTLNSKNHPNGRLVVQRGQVAVNDRPTDYVAASVYEAERAACLLSATVGGRVSATPVIVVNDSCGIRGLGRPMRVVILHGHQLCRTLTSSPARLDAVRIAALYDVARDPSTWLARRTG